MAIVNVTAAVPVRIAEVEIKYTSLKIPPSLRLLAIRRKGKGHLEKTSSQQAIETSLNLNVIWVKESDPPHGTESLEWFIYTDLPVDTIEAAAGIIDTYKLRWQIELFHKVLKSGCRIEDCRLETAERLKKYITLCSIIAWRILWMTHLNRKNPKATCDSFLTEAEWKALYCQIHQKKTPPRDPPNIHEAIHWIARLGGFLDRKSDGEPGMITIWRGWQRLSDLAEDWKLFHERQRYG